MIKQCHQCGEWFSLSKNASRRQRFCTNSCAATYRMRDPKRRKLQSRVAKQLADSRDMREMARAQWQDPVQRAHLTEKIREYSNSKKHLAHMAKHNRELWANEEFRKRHSTRTSQQARKMWSDPSYREQRSLDTAKQNRQRWANPKYKARVSAAIRTAKRTATGKLRSLAAATRRVTQEDKDRASQRFTARWQDPVLRKEMTERSRATARKNWRDPFFRARAVAALQSVAQSPEHRARMAEQNRQRWSDPDYVARQKAIRSDPEFRARIAERNRQRWADPEYKARVAKAISKAKKKSRPPAVVKQGTDPEGRSSWA